MELIKRAEEHASRTAIISDGSSYTYDELLNSSALMATALLDSKKDLNEARIAFLVTPSFEYTAVQWGIWRAGGIAVPLCVLHPLPSMQYVIEDTKADYIIADTAYFDFIKPLSDRCGIPLLEVSSLIQKEVSILPHIDPDRRAMILYTSGTTSKPKGVVSTHRHIQAQIQTLIKAWAWEKDDRIINVLPLHHVHGITNVMLCALWAGACCEFLPKFSPEKVWARIASGQISLFMGVPTMYYQLISYWDNCSETKQKELSDAASQLRLIVSGSAALPVPVLEKWRQITGHTLLERYGMTEIGMGLSNPYVGERRPGHVGVPFAGVELKLVDEALEEVKDGEAGEILIMGPSVFKEYWNKPKATKDAFTSDGWFRTGDMAVLKDGYYKILGRTSVDIIKSGGYKISALEIEDLIRKYPGIHDCAVVGLEDLEWGEVIAAALVLKDAQLDIDRLVSWMKERIPSYKLPRRFKIMEGLPRNVLGKVTKSAVKEAFLEGKQKKVKI